MGGTNCGAIYLDGVTAANSQAISEILILCCLSCTKICSLELRFFNTSVQTDSGICSN